MTPDALPRHVETCLRAAIAAIEPRALVREAMSSVAFPTVGGGARGGVHVLAIGKAARTMAAGALEGLGAPVVGGLIVQPVGHRADTLGPLATIVAEHPVPGEGSLRAGAAIVAFCDSLPAEARVLCLVSGGASALVTRPAEGLALADLRATTALLLETGATIYELNTVRKHLDTLKGGRLARSLKGADVRVLVLSDVVGDPLDVIASGPLVPDRTTFADALSVLSRSDRESRVPPAVLRYLRQGLEGHHAETPSEGDPCFDRVQHRVVGNGSLAAAAAARAAAELGYEAQVVGTALEGEARVVGRQLARIAQDQQLRRPVGLPACLVWAGETTVTVRGAGRGGRNQELVLAAAQELRGRAGIAVGSIGTDGVDGTSSAAGAVAGPDLLARATERGLDPATTLEHNDTHDFFEVLGSAIVTGPTGTNVGDVQVVLVGPPT